MSPAVLTETIWALAQEVPPVIPQSIVVIATTRGRDALDRELLTPHATAGGKRIWQLLRETVLGPAADTDQRLILETPVRLITIPNASSGTSKELDDLRTADDNRAAANFVFDEVRRIVENRETRLIASLAGGRKTMGALLYAAMTLLGRETDRLTHVLVNEPFDDPRLEPRFYFPSSRSSLHRLPAGGEYPTREVQSSNACIELADVPFVPLRNRFAEISELPGAFQGLVKHYSRQLRLDADRKTRLEIHHTNRRLIVDGHPIRMRQKALAILHALLELQDDPRVMQGHLEAQDAIDAWLQKHCEVPWRGKVTAEDLRHELSHLRTELKRNQITWQPPLRSLHFAPFQLIRNVRPSR